MRTLRKIGISLYPVEAVHVHCKSSSELGHAVAVHSYLILQSHLIVSASVLDKHPIEKVTIESCKDKGTSISDVLKELIKQCLLIWLIENSKCANIILWFGTVFEVLYVSSNDLPVGN